MLKKIRPDQVRQGMYIAKIEGPWLQHGFWRGAFLVRGDDQARALNEPGVQALWIDTARGEDLESPDPALAADAPAGAGSQEARIELIDDISVDSAQAPQALAAERETKAAAAAAPRLALREELFRARRVFLRSKPMLENMFAQARLGRSVDTSGAHELLEEISESLRDNPWALISVVRIKRADDYTYLHSAAVGALMVALARQLGLDRELTRVAGLAGMLHDIGKAAIPHEVLNKPEALTEAEFAIIKTHPRRGHDLLRRSGNVDATAVDVCLHHHERLDGTGYPDGLAGEQISLICRMATICDIYDATTSNRPYKAGWDPAESLQRMARWAPAHIDQEIFHHFVKTIGIYPVGSFVRLDSGLLGVVVDQTPGELLRPKVRAVYCTRTRDFLQPRLLDLGGQARDQRIVGLERAERWGITDPSLYLREA
jgi:putative nucleotidyltransferase with HDIG domain